MQGSGGLLGCKMTQSQIDAVVAQYTNEGWKHMDSVARLAFVSPKGRWLHTYDCDSGQVLAMDIRWLKNVGMVANGRHKN